MSADYDELLNRTWEEVPEPKLLPAGGWLLKGSNVAFIRPQQEGQSAKVLFSYKAEQPVNVAQDLLDEMGEYDFTINDLQHQIFVENAADWDKVRKHLALHGVELDPSQRIAGADGKLSFAKAFRGSEIVAEVGQRSYEKDGQTVFQNSVSKFQVVGE